MSLWNWRAGLIGFSLAVVGTWGPWIPHRAAALVLSGWDLAEFVKFVPGASAIRELFYLPAWCAGLTLLALAQLAPGEQPGRLAKQFGLKIVALGLFLAILPPFPNLLTGYQSAEFRWQFLLGVVGLLALVASSVPVRPSVLRAVAGHWPGSSVVTMTGLVGVVRVVLALVGAIPALWQFANVRGEIELVYSTRLGWGWGLGVFLGGWGLVALSGASWLMTRAPTRSKGRIAGTQGAQERHVR